MYKAVYIYIFIHVHIYIYICICTCIYVQACSCYFFIDARWALQLTGKVTCEANSVQCQFETLQQFTV